MTPFRLNVVPQCIESLDVLKANAERNQKYPSVHRRLAIVGGGPSVASHLDELRAWDGDIWAVNYTPQYLKQHGIRSTFITVDPQDFDPGPLEDALVATCCNPDLFERLVSRGVKVRSFNIAETHEGGVFGGVTTARRAMGLGLMVGHREIHVFGCEGSYSQGYSVDGRQGEWNQLIIRAGGKDYLTETGFVTQCEEMAQIFKHFGHVYKNRSGGLLQALIENPETWECVGVSAALKAHLEQVNGAQGMYDAPYQPIQEAA